MADIIPVIAPAPEFEARANALLSDWRNGTFSFVEAVDQFNTLKYEALQALHLANEALVERLMGIIRLARGHYDHAIRHFRTARELHEQLGDTERLLMCDNNIGEANRLKGELERAHHILNNTYEAAGKHGYVYIQAYCKSNDGRTLNGLGRYSEALTALNEACELANRPTVRPGLVGLLSLIHTDLTITYLNLNNHLLAFATAQAAVALGAESNDIRRQGQANRSMGRVLTVYTPPHTNSPTNPDVYFEASLTQCRETRLDIEVAHTLFAHGESLTRRGHTECAAAKFREALLIYERLELQTDVDKTKHALAGLES